MKNIIPHHYSISAKEREKLNGHHSLLIWFTGLSGSGKSTIANELEKKLYEQEIHTYTLDGDKVRTGLNMDLTFSEEDRSENIRRIGEVSNLMLDAGLVVLSAFVSPYKKDREKVKSIVGQAKFIEVFVNTSIEECERRDVKGLYAKARKGEITNFTGINAPYEAPTNPDIRINTETQSVEEAAAVIMKMIAKKLKN